MYLLSPVPHFLSPLWCISISSAKDHSVFSSSILGLSADFNSADDILFLKIFFCLTSVTTPSFLPTYFGHSLFIYGFFFFHLTWNIGLFPKVPFGKFSYSTNSLTMSSLTPLAYTVAHLIMIYKSMDPVQISLLTIWKHRKRTPIQRVIARNLQAYI